MPNFSSEQKQGAGCLLSDQRQHSNFETQRAIDVDNEGAAKQAGLKTVDILVELGRRRMVGGQEDMIVDVALDLLKTEEERAKRAAA